MAGKPKDDNSIKERMARRAAAEVTRRYLRSPNNRSQVILPSGSKSVPEVGSDAWVFQSKGRYRNAEKVYDSTYAETMDYLNKSKPSTGVTKFGAKKGKKK